MEERDRPPPEVGPVEAALQLFASSLTVREDDPRAIIVAAALKLSRALDQAQGKDTSGIARELRSFVGYMGDFGQQADALDEVRAKRALRRVALVLPEPGRELVETAGDDWIDDGGA
jgi:hypothetical protein